MALRLSLKAKQVIGVTVIVALAIAALSAVYLGLLIRVWLDETRARGTLVASTVYPIPGCDRSSRRPSTTPRSRSPRSPTPAAP